VGRVCGTGRRAARWACGESRVEWPPRESERCEGRRSCTGRARWFAALRHRARARASGARASGARARERGHGHRARTYCIELGGAAVVEDSPRLRRVGSWSAQYGERSEVLQRGWRGGLEGRAGRAGRSGANTTRKARACGRCKLHGRSVQSAGHRGCPYAACMVFPGPPAGRF
jgi:hypothetical protein